MAEQLSMFEKAHPFAARFPMMSDEEIAELARDIKANGLVHPIVRDKDGLLIDGRNRLRACEIAGVEPRYITLNGQDPIAFILSNNIERRHLSKGQRAMLAAVGQVFLKNTPARVLADDAGVSRSQIAYAAVVQQYAPALVDSVISGAMSLNEAYEVARVNKEARDTDAEREARAAAQADAWLSKLRSDASDLADLVADESLSLREAWGAFQNRLREEAEKEQERKEQNERTTRYFVQASTTMQSLSTRQVSDFLDCLQWDLPEAKGSIFIRSVWTPEALRKSGSWLHDLAAELAARKGDIS